MFDRICRENGIKHLLTSPGSPTTTGKVERWHKTLRSEFLSGKVFDSIDDAQAQLDGWVTRAASGVLRTRPTGEVATRNPVRVGGWLQMAGGIHRSSLRTNPETSKLPRAIS